MSTIGAVGSSTGMQAMREMGGRRRPDPAELAEKLFAQLDTSGQGYIEQSDLQKAFNQISGTGDTSSASDLFSKLDADSDGKVTKNEFSSALQAAAEQLDNQFANMRIQGGMPPPPPQNDAGFTKDELQSQLGEIGSSDSKRSSLISDIVQNFDKADTDGDGKVSFKEAMAFEQSQSTSTSTGTSETGAAASDDSNAKLMMQIMRLIQAYSIDSGDKNTANTIATSA